MEYPVQVFKLTHESASVTINELGDGRASVKSLFATERGKGHASMLMERVIQYAETHRLTLVLEAKRYGHPIGPDTPFLVDFYKRYGFELHQSATPSFQYMIRLLKGENNAAG